MEAEDRIEGEVRSLTRSVVEILDRLRRLSECLADLQRHGLPEHQRAAGRVKERVNNFESLLCIVLSTASAKTDNRKRQRDALVYEVLVGAAQLTRLHEFCAFFPHPPCPPEIQGVLQECLGETYQSIQPDVLLGSLLNAFEYPFDDRLRAALGSPRLPAAATLQAETIILELPLSDRESPLCWGVLAHEAGHALHNHPRRTEQTSRFTSNQFSNWSMELFCDLVACATMGSVPMLALSNLTSCLIRDRGHSPGTHPLTSWRLEIARDFLGDTMGKTLDDEIETQRLIEVGSRRRNSVSDEEEASLLEARDVLRGIANELKTSVSALGLKTPVLDNASLDRSVARLRLGLPIPAQGVDTATLLEEIRSFRSGTAHERRGSFESLCARFSEGPLPSWSILLAGSLRRSELISACDLASPESVRTLMADLKKLDEILLRSIRTAMVVRAVLQTLPEAALGPRGAKRQPQSPDHLEGTLLADVEILFRLVSPPEKRVFVTPVIAAALQVQPSSLDVHLGTKLIITKRHRRTHIDLTGEVGGEIDAHSETIRVGASGEFVLHPGDFALAETLEYIKLPTDMAARLEGRSSLGRLGLQVHATAGFIDPGFSGIITFELINAGSLPIKFKPGLRLAQLCFYRTTPVEWPYGSGRGKYSENLGAQTSKVHLDPEFSARPVPKSPLAE